MRRQNERVPPRLAHSHNRDAREIGLWRISQRRDGGLHIFDRFRIGHVVAAVAAMQRVLIGMLEEIIGGDADVPFARMAPGQIHRVGHEAVTLVQQHDHGDLVRHIRRGDEGGQAAGAGGCAGHDLGHSTSSMGADPD